MTQDWFYAEDDQKKGPFSLAQLRQMTARGHVTPTTRVWTREMSEWKEARTIEGLFDTGRLEKQRVSSVEVPPMPVVTTTGYGPPNPPAQPSQNATSGASKWAWVADRNHPMFRVIGFSVSVLILVVILGRAFIRLSDSEGGEQRRAESTTSDAKLGTLMTFNRGQLFYKPPVTQDEANRLGNYLVEANFFDGNPKSVQITKEENKYIYRMVLKQGLDESSSFLEDIQRAFSNQISQIVFSGTPVEIHLCDNTFNTIKVLPPGSGAESPGMAFLQRWMSITAKCEAAEKIIPSENVSPEERSKAVDDLYQAILGMKTEFDTMAAMLSRFPINDLPPNEQAEFRDFMKALPTIKASLPVACEALERMKTATSKTVFDANWKAFENILAQWEQLDSNENTAPTPPATATSEANRGSRYNQVRSGMSRAQAEAILGTGQELDTTETEGITLTTVMYEADGSRVNILYVDGKVKTKSKSVLP